MFLIKAKDKGRHLSKRYSTMSKVTNTELCWIHDEIELLLESVNPLQPSVAYLYPLKKSENL